jgi:hypothetical protein
VKKHTPFPIPAGTQPVRQVPTISARDPNFYEDGSGEAAREEPIEPMEMDLERGIPAPRATNGMPFKLDGGR